MFDVTEETAYHKVVFILAIILDSSCSAYPYNA